MGSTRDPGAMASKLISDVLQSNGLTVREAPGSINSNSTSSTCLLHSVILLIIPHIEVNLRSNLGTWSCACGYGS